MIVSLYDMANDSVDSIVVIYIQILEVSYPKMMPLSIGMRRSSLSIFGILENLNFDSEYDLTWIQKIVFFKD